MIDTHCHILPKVDDGADSLEEALRMARIAVHNGIHTVIATPHHFKSVYRNPAAVIQKHVKFLEVTLRERDIPLKLLPGQEYHVTENYREHYLSGQLQPLGISRYLLVELPSKHVPRYFEELVLYIKSIGLIPVVAHPERNLQLIKNPGEMYDWIGKGVLFQGTIQGLLGMAGEKIRQAAMTMTKQRWIHFLASDAHNTTTRSILLREAYDRVEAEFGSSFTDYLRTNAELLIAGSEVVMEKPLAPQRKKRFWMI
jgi:protein-tyrosine phosphatase